MVFTGGELATTTTGTIAVLKEFDTRNNFPILLQLKLTVQEK